jgi:KAP-like P-loop domain-containing protein
MRRTVVPPDDPYKNDALGHRETGRVLTDLVRRLPGPTTLSIDGPWGSGKTTLLQMWTADMVRNAERRAIGAALLAAVAAVAAAPAWLASGAFERTWGFDVDAANPGTGFEICTVAPNCKQGVVFGYAGGSLNGPIGIGTGPASAGGPPVWPS